MSKEYMQALDDLFGLVAFLPRGSFERAQKYFDVIEQALKRLEQIDNANPSEALSDLESFINNIIFAKDLINQKQQLLTNINTIKQSLLKAQEQEKVLNTIINKKVDVGRLFYSNDLDDYNEYIIRSGGGYYNLTQAEYDTIMEMLVNE